MKIDNPCKPDCAERSSTCHGKCSKYKEYKDALAVRKEEYDKHKQVEMDYFAYKSATVMKIRRNKHSSSKVMKKPMR